ncbi:MAG: hypothetical protein FWD88_05835, partial [Treponema sp.]|nr:hypothetical protein [Treponema sp.]
LDERLWSVDEQPTETEYSRILRVDRKSPSLINLAGLMEELRPVCRFDPGRPGMYRNDGLLRAMLRGAIPAMCFEPGVPGAQTPAETNR